MAKTPDEDLRAMINRLTGRVDALEVLCQIILAALQHGAPLLREFVGQTREELRAEPDEERRTVLLARLEETESLLHNRERVLKVLEAAAKSSGESH